MRPLLIAPLILSLAAAFSFAGNAYADGPALPVSVSSASDAVSSLVAAPADTPTGSAVTPTDVAAPQPADLPKVAETLVGAGTKLIQHPLEQAAATVPALTSRPIVDRAAEVVKTLATAATAPVGTLHERPAPVSAGGKGRSAPARAMSAPARAANAAAKVEVAPAKSAASRDHSPSGSAWTGFGSSRTSSSMAPVRAARTALPSPAVHGDVNQRLPFPPSPPSPGLPGGSGATSPPLLLLLLGLGLLPFLLRIPHRRSPRLPLSVRALRPLDLAFPLERPG